MSDKVPIRKLSSGVPGLDEVLGGGIPEFSFNLIAGGPGGGPTGWTRPRCRRTGSAHAWPVR